MHLRIAKEITTSSLRLTYRSHVSADQNNIWKEVVLAKRKEKKANTGINYNL